MNDWHIIIIQIFFKNKDVREQTREESRVIETSIKITKEVETKIESKRCGSVEIIRRRLR
jgi:hypothetical protein